MKFLQHGSVGPLSRSLGLATASLALATNLLGWGAPAQAAVQSSVGESVQFSCQTTEAAIRRLGGPRITVNGSQIYIGYQQVSRDNQNPIVVRFQNGQRVWCRTNYETSGDDGKGYGLLWDDNSRLYAVFSATGTQGSASADYRRFTTQGWLSSYGNGGGPQVSVIAQLSLSNGSPVRGTFLNAVLSSGRTNSLVVRGLGWSQQGLVVAADSWYSPRRADRSAFTCEGSSPFRQRIVFTPDLRRAVSSTATGCR